MISAFHRASPAGHRQNWCSLVLLALLIACQDEQVVPAPGADPAAGLLQIAAETIAVAIEPTDTLVQPDSMMDAARFAELEALWSSQRFAEALPALKAYRRSAPYGKNEVVDYMIGTSACRVPGEEELGQRMFLWLLSHYSLNPESREMVIAEQLRCPPSARMVPVNLSLVGVGPASTSGTRGKLYYYLSRGEDMPLANEPVAVHREIPLAELQARLFRPERAEEAVAVVKGLAGPGYRVEAYGPFVMASRTHTGAQLERLASSLGKHLDFYAEAYGMPRPPELLTVYLAGDASELRELADGVHGIGVSPNNIGYSFRDDLSMVGIVPGSEFGTLKHELFHLMVRRDFGDVPPWLDEGMAALYEVSEVRADGSVVGLPNWRGRVLKELWSSHPTVAELVRADWQAFEAQLNEPDPIRQAANHATARYLVLYLQEQGMLPEVYRAFLAREALAPGGDPSARAVSVLENVVGRSAETLNAEFEAWFGVRGEE